MADDIHTSQHQSLEYWSAISLSPYDQTFARDANIIGASASKARLMLTGATSKNTPSLEFLPLYSMVLLEELNVSSWRQMPEAGCAVR